MASVTIDPGVIAAPPPDSDRGVVLEYVETLLDWRRLLDEPWVSIYMSERTAEVLFEDGLFPLRKALQELFGAHGVEEYDVNTVALVAEKLLQITPSFETYFKIQDILYEKASTDPDLLSITTNKNMASELARCVLLFALLREHCQDPVVDHALVVRPWQGHSLVHVRAIIYDLEHERDDLKAIPEPPEFFEGCVWVCQSFSDLVKGIDEAAVWESAKNDEGLEIAVHIALYKHRLERGLEPEWGESRPFWFGSKFWEQAKSCCKNNPSSLIDRTLRAMVETIDELRLPDAHALREGGSGGARQRTRGQDKAWRRDIDREYHLHYWETDSGVEFGWMGPHNDFTLPE